jgi:hypothetical protein
MAWHGIMDRYFFFFLLHFRPPSSPRMKKGVPSGSQSRGAKLGLDGWLAVLGVFSFPFPRLI